MTRRKQVLLKAALVLAGAGLLAGAGALGIAWHIGRTTAPFRYRDMEKVPARPVAIVLGAGLERDGRPSPVLADRVRTAVALYRAGKARKLLVTGDNRFAWYNEPAAMGQYAEALGVPARDIVYDYAGRRTYDSCYRARHIFGITEAVVVTQEFHLPRAVYLCRQMGIDAVGISADLQPYLWECLYRLRELLALAMAWADLHIRRPLPVLGDPIPIVYDEEPISSAGGVP
ncbi:MAG: SanA/YdcF family protein [Anaerolineae bacterium]